MHRDLRPKASCRSELSFFCGLLWFPLHRQTEGEHSPPLNSALGFSHLYSVPFPIAVQRTNPHCFVGFHYLPSSAPVCLLQGCGWGRGGCVPWLLILAAIGNSSSEDLYHTSPVTCVLQRDGVFTVADFLTYERLNISFKIVLSTDQSLWNEGWYAFF